MSTNAPSVASPVSPDENAIVSIEKADSGESPSVESPVVVAPPLTPETVAPSRILLAPAITTLLLMNSFMGTGQFLTVANLTGTLSRDGWLPWEVGAAVMAGRLCFMIVVNLGGYLCDKWGRAKSAVTGSCIAACGVLIGLLFDRSESAITAGLLVNAGAGLFYPGNAGLFSDARPPAGADGAGHIPLYKKVSRYNIGWGSGNLAGFGLGMLLSGFPFRVGWGACVVILLVPAAVLQQYFRLPSHAASTDADRAAHPALPLLRLMGRVTIFFYNLCHWSFIGLLENCFVHDGMVDSAAHRLAVQLLFCYCLGYVCCFLVLERWDGWVLKPWNLLKVQLFFVAGAIALAVSAYQNFVVEWLWAIIAYIMGVGYAGGYSGSLYYSLRLPEAVGRASAVHETYVGCGASVGPALGGVFVSLVGGRNLVSLAIWVTGISTLCCLGEACIIPRATKLGAS